MAWVVNGIEGRGDTPPACAGTCKGLAVVIGTGRCMHDDVKAFDPEREGAQVVAINDAILHYHRRIHHAASLHPEHPPLWRALRGTHGCEAGDILTHASHEPRHAICEHLWPDFIWPHMELSTGGTSSLFAVFVALALGYEKVVLLGVPMDGTGHFYDAPWDNDGVFLAENIRMEWAWANERKFRGRVKSMSGRTREWLGAP